MITIESTINVLNAPNQSIDSGTINTTKSNISAEIDMVLGQKAQCSNPFIFGASILGNGATFSDDVDYFIGGVPANDNGQFSSAYEIDVMGTNINSITIAFDTKNNRHPNHIIVDTVEYENNEDEFIVAGLEDKPTHTISFSDWNTANYPAIISGIYIGVVIKVDNLNIIDLTANLISVTDNKFPQFGIMSNIGNIRFNDLSQQVKQLANADLLQQGVDVDIDIIDTVSGKKQSVAKYLTKNWNYNSNNHEVSVTLQDDLLQWQEIMIDKIFINNDCTANDIYLRLLDLTPTKFRMSIDNNSINYLKSINCANIIIKSQSLWNGWQKLCELCSAIIYKNHNGDTVFKVTR